ncbi:hypothetical protein Pla52n_69430 [Stieleria varia]|uniref:Uncharacterized protein n=1 Tax=Stieleria varia TaxID=2528005 RepID=A0A5C5ZLN3_9BACT|nr:hypothetical protein Pla52n_69430 [Stieleria varia]
MCLRQSVSRDNARIVTSQTGQSNLTCKPGRRKPGLSKRWGCVFLGLRWFMSLLPAQLVAPSEPQTLAVGLRRIVVPAHG